MGNFTSRLIGLTGGIATGKTTVSNYLAAQYNFPILDADIYARQAVSINSPILQAIFARYGDSVQLADHSLNRAALGEIIFNDLQEKQWLESQIHPFVRDRFEQELLNNTHDTVVLSIPLLFEVNLTNLVTEIWVVSCDRTLQITRLQQRNGLTPTQAIARIDTQMPLPDKVSAADVVLHNNSDKADLYAQVDAAI